MNKYNTFLLLFIAEVMAFCFFIYNYLRIFIAFAMDTSRARHADPFVLLAEILNPVIVISFIVLVITSLLTRIFGIIAIAKNKTVTEGEKIIWILGFGFMSFITSIIFLFMAKKRGFML